MGHLDSRRHQPSSSGSSKMDAEAPKAATSPKASSAANRASADSHRLSRKAATILVACAAIVVSVMVCIAMVTAGGPAAFGSDKSHVTLGGITHGRLPDSDSALVMRTDSSVSSEDTPLKITADDPNAHYDVTVLTQDFSTSRAVYIYVDGSTVVASQQPQDKTVITLSGSQITSGYHMVEAVQYAGNSPTATVTMYKKNTYLVQ